MKSNMLIFFSTVLFTASVGFAFQGQEEAAQVQPKSVKQKSKAEAVLKELELVKRELDAEKHKNDSINEIRQTNLNILKKSADDLRSSNVEYRKALNRLIYVVGKFPPDSVMKYYGQYAEPKEYSDTLKKKIDLPVINPDTVKSKKHGWFYRLFH